MKLIIYHIVAGQCQLLRPMSQMPTPRATFDTVHNYIQSVEFLHAVAAREFSNFSGYFIDLVNLLINLNGVKYLKTTISD